MKANERAVLVNISLSTVGNSRKDSAITAEILNSAGAREDSGYFSKKLFDSDDVKYVNGKVAKIRNLFYAMTKPFDRGNNGILPMSNYDKFMQRYIELKSDAYEALREKILSRYEEILEERRVSMGTLFKEHEYPTKEQLERKFDLRVNIYPLPDMSGFFENQAYDDVRHSIENTLNDGFKNMLRSVFTDDNPHRRGVIQTLQHFVERMDAVVPSFKEVTVSAVKELSETINSFNLSDDETVEEFANKIKDAFDRLTGDLLRNDSMRRSIAVEEAKTLIEEAEDIVEEMNGYM